MNFVELEGVEPSSKHGNNMLSTCLASLGFSCTGKAEATNLYLILYGFHCIYEAKCNYPRFCCTSVSSCLEERALGRCLVPAPCAGIKLNLLYFD